MISQGRGGVFKPLSQWGKAKCQRENPPRCQLPIFSSCGNHLFLPEVVELVNAWGWEEYGSQIRIGQSTHFWKKCVLA